MKKQLIFFFLLLGSISSYSQMYNPYARNRIRASQTQTQQKPKAPKFDTDKAVGYIEYEFEKVAKKIKLKSSDKNISNIEYAFKVYNKTIFDIKRLHSFTIKEMKATVEFRQKEAIDSKDFSKLAPLQKEVNKTFKPIIEDLKKEEEKLDEKLKKLLSDKQFEKWIKYKKKEKKK